jgi:hypothetical protein
MQNNWPSEPQLRCYSFRTLLQLQHTRDAAPDSAAAAVPSEVAAGHGADMDALAVVARWIAFQSQSSSSLDRHRRSVCGVVCLVISDRNLS